MCVSTTSPTGASGMALAEVVKAYADRDMVAAAIKVLMVMVFSLHWPCLTSARSAEGISLSVLEENAIIERGSQRCRQAGDDNTIHRLDIT